MGTECQEGGGLGAEVWGCPSGGLGKREREGASEGDREIMRWEKDSPRGQGPGGGGDSWLSCSTGTAVDSGTWLLVGELEKTWLYVFELKPQCCFSVSVKESIPHDAQNPWGRPFSVPRVVDRTVTPQLHNHPAGLSMMRALPPPPGA